MLRSFALVMGLCLLAASAEGAIQSKKLTYKHGDVDCIGYLAWDDAIEGPRPGVLVFHEFWGLDAYAKQRVDQLAKLGYVAFAADLYGEGKLVDHPKDAGAMAGQLRSNVDDWKKRGLEALDVLKSQPQCDKSKIAAIGYCRDRPESGRQLPRRTCYSDSRASEIDQGFDVDLSWCRRFTYQSGYH